MRETKSYLLVNLTVDWTHPEFGQNLSSYQIKFNSSRAFEELLKIHESIPPTSTQLIKNFGDIEIVNPETPEILVQVYIYKYVHPNIATSRVKPVLGNVFGKA